MVARTSYALEVRDICNTWKDDTQTRHEARAKCSYDARMSRSCYANVARMFYRWGALHMRDIRVANAMWNALDERIALHCMRCTSQNTKNPEQIATKGFLGDSYAMRYGE
jgi:hypothetical protein